MITARRSELINAPLTEVYGVMACYTYDVFWRKTLQHTHPAGPGLARAGLQFRQVMQLLGQEMAIDAEVTAAAPNRRVAYESVGGALMLWDQRTFERTEKSTRVTFEITVELKGWQRLMAPLLVHQLEQLVGTDLLVFKTLLETTPNVLIELAKRPLATPSSR